jgi:ribosomal protein S4E
VKATKEEHNYRIIPDEGEEFEVAATNEEELDNLIAKNLRAQLPDIGEKYESD